MSRPLILSGQTFGRLTAISRARAQSDKGRHAYWSCKCTCGKQVTVRGSGLTAGMHKSCGCWRRDASRGRALAFKAAGNNRFGVIYVPALVRVTSLDRRVNLAYPYLGVGAVNSCDLLTAINDIVPKGLPDHLRADIAQEMIMDVLAGNLILESAAAHVQRYIRRSYGDCYRLSSLDAPVAGTENLRLIDTIASDRFHF